MPSILGFGVPNWPRVGRTYDWWPIALPIIAIVLWAWPFGVRLTARSIVVLVVGGTATAWLGEAIGVLPAIAVGLLALSIGSAIVRRPGHRRG